MINDDDIGYITKQLVQYCIETIQFTCDNVSLDNTNVDTLLKQYDNTLKQFIYDSTKNEVLYITFDNAANKIIIYDQSSRQLNEEETDTQMANTNPIVLIIKNKPEIDLQAPVKSQLEMLIIPKGVDINTLGNLLSSGMTSLLDFLLNTSTSKNISQFNIENTKQRLLEVSKSIYNLDSTVEPLRITESLHETVKDAISKGATVDTYTDFIDNKLLRDFKYLNSLQNKLNKWIKHCQNLKAYDPPLQDDYINEVLIWGNLENVLVTSSNQIKSLGYKISLQILIDGNRLRLFDPILDEIEVETRLEFVKNCESFLKSLEVESLELISDITQVNSYLTKLSSSLRRFRFSNYPVIRFIKLIDLITKSFSNHIFKIVPNLFESNLSQFNDIYEPILELFSQWDSILRESLQQIREKIRRSNSDLSVPTTFNHQTKKLKTVLDELKMFKAEQAFLSENLKPFFVKEYTAYLEWLFSPIQSLKNDDIFIESNLKNAQKEYSKRLFQTGNNLVEKFETSLSATPKEDLFDAVIVFEALAQYFPVLKMRLHDAQHLLLSSAKSALTSLKQNLESNDPVTLSLQRRGTSKISSLTSQYTSHNSRTVIILSNVRRLLGTNWRSVLGAAMIAKESELILQQTDISKLFDIWSTNLPQHLEDLKEMCLFKVYEESIGSFTKMQIKVNFNFELPVLMRDLKTFIYYNYPVPKQIIHKCHAFNNASSIAIHIDESLQMFLYIVEHAKNFKFTTYLLKKDIDTIWLVIKKGLSIRWNDLIFLTINANSAVTYQSLLDKAISQVITKYQKLCQYELEINQNLQLFQNTNNTEADLSLVFSHIQDIANKITNENWDNISEFTHLLNRHIFELLIQKISKHLKESFFKPKTVRIILEDSEISSNPKIDVIKSAWIQEVQTLISTVIEIPLLAAEPSNVYSHYSLENVLNALEGDLVVFLTDIEARYTEGKKFLLKWKSYEFLWYINEYYLEEYISIKPEHGINIINYLNIKHSDFKQITQKDANNTFNFDHTAIYQIVETKLNYWTYFVIDKYLPLFQVKIEELDKLITNRKNLLTSVFIKLSTLSIPFELIQAIHESISLQEKWNDNIIELTQINKIFTSHRVKFSPDYVSVEQLVFDFEAFQQCLEKSTMYLENNKDAVFEQLNTQYTTISNAIIQLKNTWEDIKVNMSSHDFNTIVSKIDSIKNALVTKVELQNMTVKTAKLLLYPLPPVENIDKLLDEINDFIQELKNLICIQTSVSQHLKSIWVNCDLPVIIDKCTHDTIQIEAIPIEISNSNICRKIQNGITNILKCQDILKLLKEPSIKERHWCRIFTQLKPVNQDISLIQRLQFTLEDLLSLNLLANKAYIENIIEVAQKEYVIERALINIENNWLTTNLEYREHVSGMVLVKEWDTILSKCNEDLSELMSMKNSSYYKLHNNRCISLTDKLSSLSIILSTWKDVQFRWLSTFDVFGNNEQMKVLLPQISSRFHFVSTELITLFKRVPSLDHLIDITSIPRFNVSLSKILDALLTIRESLSDFLEMYRDQFPRFYFVGNDELLEIIGSKNSILAVSKYARKMFGSIMSIQGQNQIIDAVQSIEGEMFYLESKIDTSTFDYPSQWLGELEEQIKCSLLTGIEECSKQINKIEDILPLSEKYAFQILLVSFQIFMTSTLEKTTSKLNINEILNELKFTKAEVQNEIKSSNCLNPVSKKIRENIIVEILYYERVLSKLVEQGSDSYCEINWNYVQRLHFVKSHSDRKASISFSQGCYSSEYGLEYIGVPERLVYTENLIKCMISLVESRRQGYGGCLFGPAGTGKTETVKMLGQNLGKVVVVFNCDSTYKFAVITRLIFGIAQVGAWSCFDEFNRLDTNVLSAVASSIRLIQASLHSHKKSVEILNKTIPIKASTGLFITMNPNYEGRSPLPENLKNLFKEFSYYKPNEISIITGLIETQGFIEDMDLSHNFFDFIQSLKNDCTQQLHYDFGLRTIKRILMNCKQFGQNATLSEELLKATRRVILPFLNELDRAIFNKYELSYFNSIINDDYSELDKIFEDIALEKYMAASTTFLLKCKQLFQLQKSEQAIILLGKAGCGKTTVWKTTIDAIDRFTNTTSAIYIVDTKVLSKEELYGSLNPATLEWKDGVFTDIVRNCYSNYCEGDTNTHTWIVFDGNIDPDYAETINSVLDDNRILTLPNGERIPFISTIHLIFETNTIQYATPATISRCTIIWIEDHLVPHYDIFVQQLSFKFEVLSANNSIPSTFLNLTLQYIKKILNRELWDKLEAIKLDWSAVLNNNHLSPITSLVASLISFIVKFHTILESKDDNYKETILQKKIHHSLLTISINEFDSKTMDRYKLTLFDYFASDDTIEELRFVQVDEELSFLPYNVPNESLEVNDMFKSDIVITTKDTIYHGDVILDFLQSHTPLILCGPAGVGKTMIVTKTLSNSNVYELVTMNFSKETSVLDILSLFNRHLVYTPDGDGFILHPLNLEKEIVFFFDEINLPKQDKYGSQPVILFMRQIFEKGGFWRSLDGKWISVENVHFIGACNPSSYQGRVDLPTQFTRHTGIIFCDYPSEASLGRIYGTYFTSLFKLLPNLKFYSQDFTKASLQLYYYYKGNFNDTKYAHYIVTPRELTRLIKGLLFGVLNGPRHDLFSLIKLWAHENIRIFSDRLVSQKEKTKFNSSLQRIMVNTFTLSNLSNVELGDLFYSKWFNSEYMEISKKELLNLVSQRFETFCEEVIESNIIIHHQMIDHMLRIDRLFRQSQGHGMLVGPNRTGKTAMIKFVAWMNGLILVQPNITKAFTLAEFDTFLRDLLLKVTVDEHQVCLILDESNMLETSFLERINTLLTNADIPDLFSGEELTKLELLLKQKMNSLGMLNDSKDDAYKWFTNEITKNLHIFFTVSDPYKDDKMNSPALFNRCIIDWLGPWDTDTQIHIASKLLEQVPLNLSPFTSFKPHNSWILSNAANTIYDVLINIIISFDRKFHKEVATMEMSPSFYLDSITVFEIVFSKEYSKLEEGQRFVRSGLDKLNESVFKIREMKKNLSEKREALLIKEKEAKTTLDTLLYQQNESERKQEATEELKKIFAVQEEQTRKRHESIQKEIAEIQPTVKAAQLGVSNIKKQQLTELRSMNKPPEMVQLVLEAVCFLLGYDFTSWRDIQVFIRRDDFIYEIVHYDANMMMDSETRDILEVHYLSRENFNFAAVNRASKACGPLYEWLYAQAKYAHVLQKVIPLQNDSQEAKQAMLTAKARVLAAEEMVDDLKADVEDSKQKYSSLIREVEVIKTEMEKVEGNLERSELLIKSLTVENQRWMNEINSFTEESSQLIGNCLLTTIYFVYFGMLDEKQRYIMLQFLFNIMSQCTLEYPSGFNFVANNVHMTEKLSWIQNGLPSNEFYLENFCLLRKTNITVPYFVDPTGIVETVLQNEFGSNLVTMSFLEPNYLKRLENAIRFGSTVVIEDGEYFDPAINKLLTREYQNIAGRSLINLAGHDVDVSSDFKLFLCSRDPYAKLSNFVKARVRYINFSINESSIEMQALRITLKEENPEILSQKEELNNVNSKYKIQLRELEDALLETLNESEGNILENNELIDTLENIKKDSQNIEDKLKQTDKLIELYNTTTKEYLPLAHHCIKIFTILKQLCSNNWFTNISTIQFMEVFESIFTNIKSYSFNGKCDKMKYLIKFLYENVYSMLSINFDKTSKKVLVSLLYAAFIDNDNTGNDLLMNLFKFISGQLDDSNGLAFKSHMSSSITDELIQYIEEDKLLEVFNKFQTLLGPEDNLTQLMLRSNESPVIMVNESNEDGSVKFENLSVRNKKKLITIPLGSIENTEMIEKEIVQNANNDNVWLLLQNIQFSLPWVENYLIKEMERINSTSSDVGKLKILMSCNMDNIPLPFKLFERSYNYVNESDVRLLKIVKDVWFDNEFDLVMKPNEEINKEKITSLYYRFRYLLTWLHGIFVSRSRLSPYGFTKKYDFNIFDYKSVITYLKKILNEVDKLEDITSLMKFYVQDIVYGGKIDVEEDKAIVDSLCKDIFTHANKVVSLPISWPVTMSRTDLDAELLSLQEPSDFMVSWLGISHESISFHDKEEARLIANRVLEIYNELSSS